jgi:hypothetical protein
MPTLTAVLAAMIVSVGVLSFPSSIVNAQQPGTLTGTIASLQNRHG